MNLFPEPTFNSAYLSPNSAKPIAGKCTNTAFKRPLVQARMQQDTEVASAVTVALNSTAQGNAGTNLAPTTLKATTATTAIDGFVVMTPNLVLAEGDSFPAMRTGQIGHVALLGSGAELYLPCTAADILALTGVTATTTLKWDVANNVLNTKTGVSVAGITILSEVVDGVKSKKNGTSYESEDAAVVKVRI